MNKKISFVLVGLLAIGFVTALGYYAMFNTTFTVNPSITISEICDDALKDVYDGGITEGTECVITNKAPSERIVSISSETDCNIETTYASTVDMNKKDVNWSIIPNTTVIMSYTTIGDVFHYKVDKDLTNHVVIYYSDVDGNPGAWNIENAVEIGSANTEWTLSSVIDKLPKETDWNDMAKLWIIPKEDWEAKSWNPEDWYFENNLITYGNSITINANSSTTVIPLYNIEVGEDGDCTVNNTIT